MNNGMFQNVGDSGENNEGIRGVFENLGSTLGDLAKAFGIDMEAMREQEKEKTRQRLIASAMEEFSCERENAEALVDLQLFTGLGDNEELAKGLYNAMAKEFIPLTKGLAPWAKIRALIGKPQNAKEVLYEKLYDEDLMRISGLLELGATLAMILVAWVDALRRFPEIKREYFTKGRKEPFPRAKLLLAAKIVLKTRLADYEKENDLK